MVGSLFIIEDDSDISNVYQNAFGSKFKVTCFKSGEECLQSLADGCDHPDALLVDHRLPKMSGIDFIRAARGHDLSAPAVIITGAPSQELTMASISLNVHGILTKPCRIEEVHHKLQFLVTQHQARKIADRLFHEVEYFVDCSEYLDSAHKQLANALMKERKGKDPPLKVMIQEKEIEKWRKELVRARNLVDNLKAQFHKLKEK